MMKYENSDFTFLLPSAFFLLIVLPSYFCILTSYLRKSERRGGSQKAFRCIEEAFYLIRDIFDGLVGHLRINR